MITKFDAVKWMTSIQGNLISLDIMSPHDIYNTPTENMRHLAIFCTSWSFKYKPSLNK